MQRFNLYNVRNYQIIENKIVEMLITTSINLKRLTGHIIIFVVKKLLVNEFS